jgi:hypothetical protein
MVRAKFGKNIESLQMGEVISDIRFDDQPRAATATTTGTQMQSVNVALTDVIVEPREERKVSEVWSDAIYILDKPWGVFMMWSMKATGHRHVLYL